MVQKRGPQIRHTMRGKTEFMQERMGPPSSGPSGGGCGNCNAQHCARPLETLGFPDQARGTPGRRSRGNTSLLGESASPDLTPCPLSLGSMSEGPVVDPAHSGMDKSQPQARTFARLLSSHLPLLTPFLDLDNLAHPTLGFSLSPAPLGNKLVDSQLSPWKPSQNLPSTLAF